MKIKIVETSSQVVLVGGGEINFEALAADVSTAGAIVAADGGAEALLARGHVPDAVFGDMDSLDAAVRRRLPPGVLRPVTEQDSTDFDKCLRHIKAPLVLGHGFLGARLDHQLAAMHVLAARPAPRCVLIGARDVVCLCPPALTLEMAAEARVSLFPMAPVTGRSEGLRWPINGLRFAPERLVGTSNMALGGRLRLEMDAPAMLLILPVAYRAALVSALAQAALWGAPAGRR